MTAFVPENKETPTITELLAQPTLTPEQLKEATETLRSSSEVVVMDPDAVVTILEVTPAADTNV